MKSTRRLLGISIAWLVIVLSGCTGNGDPEPSRQPTQPPMATININEQPRGVIAEGGELRLPVDSLDSQFNPLHADGAGEDTELIMSALLPRLFHRDASGNPVPNPDYLSAVNASGDNPQVVTYTLNPDAVWGNGRQMDASDFIANWEACNGQNVSFDCADTEALAEVASVEEGSDPQQVVVTYRGSYSDWPQTFEYLLPREGVQDPEVFNEGWTDLSEVNDWLGGPFQISQVDPDAGVLITVPDSDWWADPPKLDQLTFVEMAGKDRVQALQDNRIDVAGELGERAEAQAERIAGCEVRTAGEGKSREAVAVPRSLANYGAFGESTPVWPDVGYLPPTT